MTMIVLSMFALMTSAVAADDLDISLFEVEIDGDEIYTWDTVLVNLERNQDLDVKVKFETDAATSADDVEITVFLTGNKDKVSETTEAFDVKPDTRYTKKLSVPLPQRMDDRNYQLRVVISSPNSNSEVFDYQIEVESEKHSMVIKDVTFSPYTQVQAGRAFTANVRLKNYGVDDEKDVKVVISVPELGLQRTTYIDEIEKDEAVSTEEEATEDLLLRVPADAKTGTYDVEVKVYYDDGDEKVSTTESLRVIGSEAAADAVAPVQGTQTGKVTITVGPQAQSVARGESGVIYPVTMTNSANVAKTYTLTVSGVSTWGTSKVSPTNVIVLQSGEQKQAYVYVAANENSALGEHVFSLDVSTDNEMVQQVPLRADVLEGAAGSAWNGVKKALQVAVILLIVLIVVLGIVIGFQKNRKDDNKDDVEDISQTYY